jgi:hypothetical protein
MKLVPLHPARMDLAAFFGRRHSPGALCRIPTSSPINGGTIIQASLGKRRTDGTEGHHSSRGPAKLGIPRHTLESKLRKLGIHRHRFKTSCYCFAQIPALMPAGRNVNAATRELHRPAKLQPLSFEAAGNTLESVARLFEQPLHDTSYVVAIGDVVSKRGEAMRFAALLHLR